LCSIGNGKEAASTSVISKPVKLDRPAGSKIAHCEKVTKKYAAVNGNDVVGQGN
jgi:hypothetical protein